MNRAMTGIWKNEKGEEFTADMLYEHILKITSGLVFLSGPSMCGKTAMLKKIQSESERKINISECDDIIQCLIKNIESKTDFNNEIANMAGDDILAVENIDFMKNKETTQKEFGLIFKQLISEGHLIIVTGIKISQRVPDLLETLNKNCELFEFISK